MAKRIKITTFKYRKKVNRPPLRVSRPISTVEPADSTLKLEPNITNSLVLLLVVILIFKSIWCSF